MRRKEIRILSYAGRGFSIMLRGRIKQNKEVVFNYLLILLLKFNMKKELRFFEKCLNSEIHIQENVQFKKKK